MLNNNQEPTIEEINEEIIKTQIKNFIAYYTEKVQNNDAGKWDVLELEKFLREYGAWLTDEERKEIEELIQKIKKILAKAKNRIIIEEEIQPQ